MLPSGQHWGLKPLRCCGPQWTPTVCFKCFWLKLLQDQNQSGHCKNRDRNCNCHHILHKGQPQSKTLSDINFSESKVNTRTDSNNKNVLCLVDAVKFAIFCKVWKNYITTERHKENRNDLEWSLKWSSLSLLLNWRWERWWETTKPKQQGQKRAVQT